MSRFSPQKALPYVLSLLFFYVLTLGYFHREVLDDMRLPQGDLVQFEGMKQLSETYSQQHGGEAPLWNVGMFSGFPEYLIASFPDGPLHYMAEASRGLFLLGDAEVARAFFLCLLGFWVMGLSFGLRPLYATVGAAAFALGSFFLVSLEAGHMTKMWAIAYAPAVLGGLALIFGRRYLLGLALFTLSLALELRAGHFQITYYLLFVCVAYGLSELWFAYKNGAISAFMLRVVPLAVIGAMLAAATQTAKLWTTKEYSEHSIRGAVELKPLPGKEETVAVGNDGLDKEYAFSWSQGKMETLTLLVPYLYGGSSHEAIKAEGPLGKELIGAFGEQARQLIEQPNFAMPLYFGDQPFTAGPVYAGAIVCFLFALSMLLLPARSRYWILAGVLISVAIAWGRNFPALNYTLFDYLPGFNKFRSVSMALSMALMLMPLAGMLALQRFFDEPEDVPALSRMLYIAGGATVGLAFLLFILAGSVVGGTPQDTALFAQGFGIQDNELVMRLVKALQDERLALMRHDAIRSAAFIALAFVVLMVALHKHLKSGLAVLLIGALIVVDLWTVDKRYVNDEDFMSQRDRLNTHQPSEADRLILQDTAYYRVANLQGNAFTEAQTSYFHRSVGGYFAAKLRRYQDLIERRLMPEQRTLITSLQSGQGDFLVAPTYNMLNAKYYKFGDKAETVLPNPAAMGPAWFVSNVMFVDTPDQEMEALDSIDVRKQAVVDVKKFPTLKQADYALDSTARIELQQQDNRKLVYRTRNAQAGLAVFSEIYYPEGWEVRLDGKDVTPELLRANYVLRALPVPAGEHTVEFYFNPDSYVAGQRISVTAGWIVFGICLLAIGAALVRKPQQEPKQHA